MEYLAKSTVLIAIFYIFYKMFLEKETFFNSIRTYFLVGILISLALPYLVITRYVDVVVQQVPVEMDFVQSTPENLVAGPNWSEILMGIYLLGVLFFAARFVIQLGSLAVFVLSHEKVRKDKYILIETRKKIAPFSFFNVIVYNGDAFNRNELDQILAHEIVHADQFHSLDIILVQCLTVFNWFNPFVWFYHKEIQKNLEFVADDLAQAQVIERKKYQYLLLKTISPKYKMALTSNFYNSLIKKRINMLHKNRSNKSNQVKFALIVPILMAFVFIFNTEVIAQGKAPQKKVDIERHIQDLIITKDDTDADLTKIKNDFLEEGVTIKFKGIDRNPNGEIIAIKIDVSTSKSKANYSTRTSSPIKPIQITYDSNGESISIGNFTEDTATNITFTSDGKHEKHGTKTYFVSKSGDGDIEKHIVKIGGSGGDVWVSDTGDSTKIHQIKVIHTDGRHSENVWVSKSGDSTNVKVIEIHGGHGEDSNEVSKNVWVSKDGDEVEEIIIKKRYKDGDENMIFISEDGEQPLMIVDGKEVPNKNMKDLDHKNIETMEVLKGSKAIEKYGEKAKDGVIIIKTKK